MLPIRHWAAMIACALLSIPVNSLPPDELRRFVAAETVRLGNIVRKAGLSGTE